MGCRGSWIDSRCAQNDDEQQGQRQKRKAKAKATQRQLAQLKLAATDARAWSGDLRGAWVDWENKFGGVRMTKVLSGGVGF